MESSDIGAAVEGAMQWLSFEWKRTLAEFSERSTPSTASTSSSPATHWPREAIEEPAAAAATAGTAATGTGAAGTAAATTAAGTAAAATAGRAAGGRATGGRAGTAAARDGGEEEERNSRVLFGGEDAPYTPPPPAAVAAGGVVYSWRSRSHFSSTSNHMHSQRDNTCARKYAAAPLISLASLVSWQDLLEEEEEQSLLNSSCHFPSRSCSSSSNGVCNSSSSVCHSSSSNGICSSSRSVDFHCSDSSRESGSSMQGRSCSNVTSNRGSSSSSRSKRGSSETASETTRSSSSSSNAALQSSSGNRESRKSSSRRKGREEDGAARRRSKEEQQRPSPFPVDVDLNKKIYLFSGNPCILEVDALISYTKEHFEAPSEQSLTAVLHAVGGVELQKEILSLEPCKAGEARICRSFNLPSSHIIFTVGPRSNNKYLTATHNALNGCIRESFLLLEEHGLRTAALPLFQPVVLSPQQSSSQQQQYVSLQQQQQEEKAEDKASFSSRWQQQQQHLLLQQQQQEEKTLSYPSVQQQQPHVYSSSSRQARQQQDSGSVEKQHSSNTEEHTEDISLFSLGGSDAYIHTTLRTLRRWLERLRTKIDAIVIVAQTQEHAYLLHFFFSLYFPRSKHEEVAAVGRLPRETGDETGQISLAARRIRIERLQRLPRRLRGRQALPSGKQQQQHLQHLQQHEEERCFERQERSWGAAEKQQEEEQQQQEEEQQQQDAREQDEEEWKGDPLAVLRFNRDVSSTCNTEETFMRKGLPVFSRSSKPRLPSSAEAAAAATQHTSAAAAAASARPPSALYTTSATPCSATSASATSASAASASAASASAASASAASASAASASAASAAASAAASPASASPEQQQFAVLYSAARSGQQRSERDSSKQSCTSSSEEEEGEEEEESCILSFTDVSFTEAKTKTETEKRLSAMRQQSQRDSGEGNAEEEGELLYHRYLRRALAISNCAAFRQFDNMHFLYCCGTDRVGRPLLVFLAALFPSSGAAAVDTELLLLYIVKTLDPYIRDKYTLLYVNTGVQHSSLPSLSLWKEFFSLFAVYENTLDQLLVLHPDFFFKAVFTCCWPCIASHVWAGTYYLHSLKELLLHVDAKELQVPDYVLELDKKPKKTFLGMKL